MWFKKKIANVLKTEQKVDGNGFDLFCNKVFLVGSSGTPVPTMVLSKIGENIYDVVQFVITNTGKIKCIGRSIKFIDPKVVIGCILPHAFPETGYILSQSQFKECHVIYDFIKENGYCPEGTIEEQKKEEKRMEDVKGKFQVLITHAGISGKEKFTASDYTDEETANKWCSKIWLAYNSDTKFMKVIKVKENLETRLNISDLFELEVIRSEDYAARNFQPYWKL